MCRGRAGNRGREQTGRVGGREKPGRGQAGRGRDRPEKPSPGARHKKSPRKGGLSGLFHVLVFLQLGNFGVGIAQAL